MLGDEVEEEENLQNLLENIPGCENIDQSEISEWLNADDPELDFNDQDIVDMVLQAEENTNSDADDVVENSRVTADEGFNALEVRVFPLN